MYDETSLAYALSDFGVAAEDETDEIFDFEYEPLPVGFEEAIKQADENLWNRMYSIATLQKVKNVPRAADGSIDRSENDFVIVSNLMRMGYSESICATVLRHPVWECGSKGREKGIDYITRTVAAVIRERRSIPTSTIHAFGPDGKFSPEIAAQSIVDKYHITWFRGELYAYEDGYYQAGSSTAEYVALQGRLTYALRPINLSDTRALVREKALVNPATLDDSGKWIAVNNGLVNLEDGTLIPPTPSYFTPGKVPITYQPEIEDSYYEILRDYVRTVVGEENEKLVWYQIGMCLTTDSQVIRNPIALILHGPRSTGKSELLRLVADFLGPANVSSIPITSLAGEKDYYTWNLMGKRANITHEAPPEISLLDTGRFKTLISGDETELRQISKAPVAANNYARFFLAMNHELRTKGVDPALYKRIRIIKTTHDFTNDPNAKPGYSKTLAADPMVMSAMFNLALQGLWELKQVGAFPDTEMTRAAINEQREANDSVEEFLVECTDSEPEHFESPDEMYSAYVQYCGGSRNGAHVGKKVFRKRVEEIVRDRTDLFIEYKAKYLKEKSNTYTGWVGRRISWTKFSVEGKNTIKLVKPKGA